MTSPGEQAGFLQSVCWARIVQQIDLATPLFLDVVEGEKLLARLLVFHYKPWDREAQKPKQGLRQFITGEKYGWLEWRDGPKFFSEDPETITSILELLLAWLDEFVHLNRIGRIRGGGPPISDVIGKPGAIGSFIEHGYFVEYWATYLVDILQSEEALWSNLDRSARKNIRKARRADVHIRKMHSFEEYLRDYYGPYVASEVAAGRSTNPSYVSKVAWQEDSEGYYHYYIAESEQGETLGTLGMYIFNGIATEIMSALMPTAYSKRIPAQDFLHWELLLEAKQLRAHTFDLAGVNPNPQDPKEEGIRRFKSKWGGRYVEYPWFEKKKGIQKGISQVREWMRT